MAAVKYAHLHTKAFNQMLEKEDDNKQEARVNAWVYLSMRQEGRVQITAAMLKTRLQMLRQACEELPPIWGSKCEATMLLQAFVAHKPEQNPVALNYAIVQLVVDGKKRLGVRWPFPISSDISPARAPGACMSPYVVSEVEDDEVLLQELVRKAELAMVLPAIGGKGDPELSSSCGTGGDTTVRELEGDGAELDGQSGGDNIEASGETVEYPKGRLGNHVQKTNSKLSSMLLILTSPGWQTVLKDATLRSHQRTAAGLGQELIKSEYPTLVCENKKQQEIIAALLELSHAVTAYKKDEKTTNLLIFACPLTALTTAVRATFGRKASLDAELLVYQVPNTWKSNMM